MKEPTDTNAVLDPDVAVWVKWSDGLWHLDGRWYSPSPRSWDELEAEYGPLTPLYPRTRPDDVAEWALHSDRWTWTEENGTLRNYNTLNDVRPEDRYPDPPKPAAARIEELEAKIDKIGTMLREWNLGPSEGVIPEEDWRNFDVLCDLVEIMEGQP